MNKREFVEKLKMHGAWCTECHDINGEKDRYVKVAKVRELLEQLDEPQGEKVEAHLAEHWNEDVGDVLWWNFPVEEPPYCGTPLDEHFPKYKTHFSMIDMPTEIEKPKRWVVRLDNGRYVNDFQEAKFCIGIGITLEMDCLPPFKFTDKAKAEAVATLVDGSVEEVAE